VARSTQSNNPAQAENELVFKQGTFTAMTTTKSYDNLNRLTAISSIGGASSASPISYAYTYNAANQRTLSSLADSSYWRYDYDALGQSWCRQSKRLEVNGIGRIWACFRAYGAFFGLVFCCIELERIYGRSRKRWCPMGAKMDPKIVP